MVQQKVVHSLLLFLFFSIVTGSIFFLLSMQLSPLLHEMGNRISTTKVMAEVSRPSPTPTPTLPQLTLDMVATLPPTPTALPVAPTPSPALVTSHRMGMVNSDLVNLRSYPSLAGEVVGQAKQGERFEIIATSDDGGWLRICCPLGSHEETRQSWVATEFIALELPPPSEWAAPSATSGGAPQPLSEPVVAAANQGHRSAGAITGTVNSVLVNLRSGPDTTYATVGQVGEQMAVMITGRNAAGTWWRICCPPGAPQESWISAEFVNLAVDKAQAMVQVVLAVEQ